MTFFINYLGLSTSIFIVGLVGLIITRRSILRLLISFEVMLLGLNLNFIFYSLYLDDLIGQVFSLVILTIAAAESSIALAILMIYYRLSGSASLDLITNLKG